MFSLAELPNDHVTRCLSPARGQALCRLIDAVEACEEALNTQERSLPHFQQLWRYYLKTMEGGITLSSLGRLLAASENWLERYKSADQTLNQHALVAQQRLRTLCRELPFTHIATKSDVIAYRREIQMRTMGISPHS